MTEELIPNQLQANVLINDLKNVVKTRLLGINECIRQLRKNERAITDYKDKLNLYKLARAQTNTVLNKLVNLLNKGEFTLTEFKQLKQEFIEMTIPDIEKQRTDDEFEHS
jgi:hypothetical protein